MSQSDPAVQVTIAFDALVEALKGLSLADKNRLLLALEEMLGQDEEALIQDDPASQAEIRQAKMDFEAGDYMTLEDYLEQRRKTDAV